MANTLEEEQELKQEDHPVADGQAAQQKPDAHDEPEKRQGHPVRNIIIVIAILAVFLAYGIIHRMNVASENNATAKAASDTKLKVQTVRAQHSPPTATLDLPGDIEAVKQASVTARATGYLKNWYVDIGDKVHAGQVLATIDTPDEDQDLLQAQSSLAAAEAAESQAQANLIAQQGNLEQSRANLSHADASLAQASQQVDQQKAVVAQAQQTVAQDNANLVQAQANRDLAKVTATRYQNLVNEKAVAQQTADQEAVAYQTANANVDALQATVGAAKANVHAAQAGVQAAQSNVSAYRDALIAARSAVDTAAANVTASRSAVVAAQANVNSAQEALTRQSVETGYQNVTAPISGIITARNVDIGDLVNAGTTSSTTVSTGSTVAGVSSPGATASGGATGSSSGGSTTGSLFTIAQLDKVRIYINIPQSDVEGMSVGTVAHVQVRELPSKAFTGVITRTADALDPDSRTLVAEVDVNNPKQILRPGMFAELEFDVPQPRNILIIPDSALITVGNGTQVAIATSDNTVHLQDIEVGRDFGQTMQVLGGLAPTDNIIDNPQDGLREGQKISATPEKVKKTGS